MTIERGESDLLELSMDTWLAVSREDELPEDLSGLSLEQCEGLVPNGPGGWRKVSAILHCLLRETRAGRDEAERIRGQAFAIKKAAESECGRVQREAKDMVQRGDIDARQAKARTDLKIAEIKAEADQRFSSLRTDSIHKHNEHDILLGKLQAVLETQGKCLEDSEKVFEDHEEEIREIMEFSDRKFDEFESSLEQIEDSFSKLRANNKCLEERLNLSQSEITRNRAESQKYLVMYSLIPTLGIFILYAWVYATFPTKTFQETNPRFLELNERVEALTKGIESKIANLEIDTATEFKMSNKKLVTRDKNLEQRFDIFVSSLEEHIVNTHSRLGLVDGGLEDQKAELDALNQAIDDNIQQLRMELLEEFYHASNRFDEFMKAKLLLTKTSSKQEKRRGQEGIYLGLYQESGREGDKPVFTMINGNYKLHSKNDNQWVISSLDNSMLEEEEIFLQHNPQIPEIMTDRWKYPSHKTALVHNVPCCRNVLVDRVVYALTDLLQRGRGVWKSPIGIQLSFHASGQWKTLVNGVEAESGSTSLCPADTNKVSSYSSELQKDILIKCL